MAFQTNVDLFKRIWDSGFSKANERQPSVQVGDRFYQVGLGSAVWVVERFCAMKDRSKPHVVLRKQGPSEDQKIIAVASLLHDGIFNPDRRSSNRLSRGIARRRKGDLIALVQSNAPQTL